MKNSFKLTGVNKVVKNLNKVASETVMRSHHALLDAGVLIRNDMATTPPLIPIKHGNLNASWFISTYYTSLSSGSFEGEDSGKLSSEHSSTITTTKAAVSNPKKPGMVMGFSAYYATYVHEMPDGNNYTRKGSGPKFFESALNRNKAQLLALLGKELNMNKNKRGK